MTKRLTSIGSVAAAALAACFGEGPTPTSPSEATVVLAEPAGSATCSGGQTYVGDVAIGLASGYAVAVPYEPRNCGNGQQNGIATITSFDELGNNPSGMNLGSAGMTNGAGLPRVATNGSNVAWAFQGIGGQLTLGPTQTPLMPSGPFQSGAPCGIIVDANRVYVAVAAQGGNGGTDPSSPNYPCCGGGPGGGSGSDTLAWLPIPTTSTPVTPTVVPITDPANLQFFSDEVSDVLVANSSSLYFIARGDPAAGHQATIGALNRFDLTVKTLDNISSTLGSVVPVGFAADDAHVVWAAASPASIASMGGPIPGGCWIWSYDLPNGPSHMLFESSQLSCMGAAIDDGHVYFTIVRSEASDCHGCQVPLHGDGLARVAFADNAFESIALGISGYGAGPRRVYVLGGQMYAVAPLAIAKIAVSAFTGQIDIPK